MDRKNILISTGTVKFVSQILTFVLNFFVRKVVIEYIGISYLGLNGVIGDLLSMLSLTELGFQSAIIFRLYRPISENDQDSINNIVSALRKIYSVVGSVILVAGLCMIPFLPLVINDSNLPIKTVTISYIILLISSVASYFLSYRRALLYADQKQIVGISIDTWVSICISSLKIISVIYFRNYYIFVVLSFVQTVVSNTIVNWKCKKLYPNLKVNNAIDGSLKKALIGDTKNIFAGKIASYVYSSTDNLVISSIISTSMVGIVGNYSVIIKSVAGLIIAFMSPFQPMIGDYLVTETSEKNKAFFDRYTFIRYCFALLFIAPASVVIERFITLFYGTNFLLSPIITALLVSDQYISIVHGPIGEYINAAGLFKAEKNVLVVGAIANLCISIVLAFYIGPSGVLIGTVVSQLIIWIGKSRIAFEKVLKYAGKEIRDYWLNQLYCLAVYIISCILSFFVTKNIPQTILGFLVSGLISVSLSALCLCIFYFKTDNFIFLKDYIQTIIKKKQKRI